MMTADEMFREQGYSLSLSVDNHAKQYTLNDLGCTSITVTILNKKDTCISKRVFKNGNRMLDCFDAQEILACAQLIKEMRENGANLRVIP